MQRATWKTTATWCTAFFAAACMAVSMTACEKQNASTGDTAAASGTMTATGSDAAPSGSIPAGYVAQLDRSSGQMSEISYIPDGSGRWEVRTGPAHILYSANDTMQGKYRATVMIEQLAKPDHPEAYGIFFGGTELDDSTSRKYTYFIVRGDGKYMVKVRDGANTKTITDWTAHAAIPTENGGGKAVYGITVDVDGKTANVSVNGKLVTSIPSADAPLHGIAGVRVNHSLHVMVTPLAITR